MACDETSSNCKDFLVVFIRRFSKFEMSMVLENKYILYGEESISKFQIEMRQRMMQALHVPLWMDEMLKIKYLKFINNMVHKAF